MINIKFRKNKAYMQPLVLLSLLIIGSHATETDLHNEDDTNSQSENILKENYEPVFAEPLSDALSEINNSASQSSNVTIEESSNSTTNPENETGNIFKCFQVPTEPVVQLVNDTELIKLLMPGPKSASRNVAAPCIAVLFYSKNCPFSSMAAPHFNALARAFTDIKLVAINAMHYHLFNTQNGIVGVPTLLLFHNGRSVIRYNGSEYNLEAFISFIAKNTNLIPIPNSVVTSSDFAGPVVSSPSKDSDMFLILSWLFIVVCSCYYFSKSRVWKWMVETIQRNWRESEQHAQHEHME
ncbi:thioredoxin domain-containing protein 15-like [Dendroctonus ponderosae]